MNLSDDGGVVEGSLLFRGIEWKGCVLLSFLLCSVRFSVAWFCFEAFHGEGI